MSKNFALLVVAAAFLSPAQGATITVTNTFNTAATVANGVHALGVTFAFTQSGNPSDAAIYGSIANTTGSLLSPLSDPVLEGPADGILTLTFDSPSTFLSFDLAFGWEGDSGGQVTAGGTSQAFISQTVTSKAFKTTGGSGLLGLFSLGSFLWVPASPFTQAVITFDSTAAKTSFDLDNLSYNVSDSAAGSPVPEPGSLISLGSGALLLGMLAGLRSSRASGHSR